jgi:hypothetical protein
VHGGGGGVDYFGVGVGVGCGVRDWVDGFHAVYGQSIGVDDSGWEIGVRGDGWQTRRLRSAWREQTKKAGVTSAGLRAYFQHEPMGLGQ